MIPGPMDVSIKDYPIVNNHELYNDIEEQNDRRTDVNVFRKLYY